jgi:hypothetical protein
VFGGKNMDNEVERPKVVIVGVCLHGFLALYFLIGPVLFLHSPSLRSYVVAGVLALVQILDIVGLLSRFRWARWYSICVFAFYFLANLGNIGTMRMQGNVSGLLWSGILMLLFVYVISSFTFADVKSYFSKKKAV